MGRGWMWVGIALAAPAGFLSGLWFGFSGAGLASTGALGALIFGFECGKMKRRDETNGAAIARAMRAKEADS